MTRTAVTDRPDKTTVASVVETEAIFVSIADTAKILGLGHTETQELLRKQIIESRVHGRRRLVLLSSLREFADSLPTERDE